jgi:Txe/YoeB family toxin of Txe-Axe toxin-antitoxin module
MDVIEEAWLGAVWSSPQVLVKQVKVLVKQVNVLVKQVKRCGWALSGPHLRY